MDRRDFLKASALASAGGVLGLNYASGQSIKPNRVAIQSQVAGSMKTRLASRELLTGLHLLHPALEIRQAGNDGVTGQPCLHSPSTKQDSRISKSMKSLLRNQAPLYAPPLNRLSSLLSSTFWKGRALSSALTAPRLLLIVLWNFDCLREVSPGRHRHLLLCADCCRGLISSTVSASTTTRISKHILQPCFVCVSTRSACMSTQKTNPIP